MANAAANPIIMMVSDWSRFTSTEYIAAEAASNLLIFCVDSVLVNGKGRVICPGMGYLWNQSIQDQPLWPGHNITDKGCFPFVSNTESIWLPDGNPDLVPPGLQSGCVASHGSEETITVDPEDKWVSLNFIDAATFKTLGVGIDHHEMWVYEVDGQYVEPRLADTFLMWAGERYSVMVKLDQPRGDYQIRIPDVGFTQVISGYAKLRYKGGRDTIPPKPFLDYNGAFLNNATIIPREDLIPYPPLVPPAPVASDAMFVLELGKANASWKFTMNGKDTYQQDRDAYSPLLYYPNSPDATDSLVIRTKNGSWVDIVLQTGYLPFLPQDFPHVPHKHGSKTWRIGLGSGIWNYSSVAEAIESEPQSFNLVNPGYRDTWVTAFEEDFPIPTSWIVLRYQVTNPGPFLFHCHIEEHLATGMAVAIMDGVDAWPKIPPRYSINQHGL